MELLLKALEDRDPLVRADAARALGRAGSERAIVPLLGLSLLGFRCLRNGGEPMALIEPVGGLAADRSVVRAPQAGFRTGLSEADLGLTPEERGEFE